MDLFGKRLLADVISKESPDEIECGPLSLMTGALMKRGAGTQTQGRGTREDGRDGRAAGTSCGPLGPPEAERGRKAFPLDPVVLSTP